MSHAEALLRIMAPVQERICQPTPPLPRSVDELLTKLRVILQRAKKAGLLTNTLEEITSTHLKKHEPLTPDLYKRQRLEEAHHPLRQTAAIFGGEKNMKRDPGLRHFRRDDGAWFDFTLTVFQGPQGLELLAYDFEIRFPSGEPVEFLRFDLNGPANPRPDGMRCHLHPNSDDDEVSLPAPVMSPEEMLGFLIYGMRSPTKPRHRKGAPAA